MVDITDLLNEREKTHGSYLENTSYIQEIKDIMRGSRNWNSMQPHQKETLEMIAHKIGRILDGDPYFADHWIDISGYAKLTADRLEGK